MYRKELKDIDDDSWLIINPFGIHICIVLDENDADTLLWLLNRGE